MNIPDVFSVVLTPEPEDIHPRELFDDEEWVAYVLEEAEWNPWAWCCAKVEVTDAMTGAVAVGYLGGCSYEDEEDFRKGGYFEDMVLECIRELEKKRKAIFLSLASYFEGGEDPRILSKGYSIQVTCEVEKDVPFSDVYGALPQPPHLWGWCRVTVGVKNVQTGAFASRSLGSCSYMDEAEFLESSDFDDMVLDCIRDVKTNT